MRLSKGAVRSKLSEIKLLYEKGKDTKFASKIADLEKSLAQTKLSYSDLKTINNDIDSLYVEYQVAILKEEIRKTLDELRKNYAENRSPVERVRLCLNHFSTSLDKYDCQGHSLPHVDFLTITSEELSKIIQRQLLWNTMKMSRENIESLSNELIRRLYDLQNSVNNFMLISEDERTEVLDQIRLGLNRANTALSQIMRIYDKRTDSEVRDSLIQLEKSLEECQDRQHLESIKNKLRDVLFDLQHAPGVSSIIDLIHDIKAKTEQVNARMKILEDLCYLKRLRDETSSLGDPDVFVDYALYRISKDSSFSIKKFFTGVLNHEFNSDELEKQLLSNFCTEHHCQRYPDQKCCCCQSDEDSNQQALSFALKVVDPQQLINKAVTYSKRASKYYREKSKKNFSALAKKIMDKFCHRMSISAEELFKIYNEDEDIGIKYQTYTDWVDKPELCADRRPEQITIFMFLIITEAIIYHDPDVDDFIHQAGYFLTKRYDFDLIAIYLKDYKWDVYESSVLLTPDLFFKALKQYGVDCKYPRPKAKRNRAKKQPQQNLSLPKP